MEINDLKKKVAAKKDNWKWVWEFQVRKAFELD